MKKFILGFITCLLLFIPIITFSASNLAEKLKGKILLAVEDKGKTYYVHEDGNRYRITSATAHKIFEKLALGITNKDLENIPIKDVGIDPESNENSNELKQCLTDKNMWQSAYNEWHTAYYQLEDKHKLCDTKFYEMGDVAQQWKDKYYEMNTIAKGWEESSESWEKSFEDWKALAIKGGDKYTECVAIAEEWKNEYLFLYKQCYALNSTAIIECYNNGYLISCYDITLFPTELVQKLEEIGKKHSIPMILIERQKAKIIKDYYGY